MPKRNYILLNKPSESFRVRVERGCIERRRFVVVELVRHCSCVTRTTQILNEFRWQVRRASAALTASSIDTKRSRNWTMTELRKQKQLQNDLDIPLTIFMAYSPNSSARFGKKSLVSNASSVSLRMTNIASYQPVLEHIRHLEEHIQQVISLTGQLIEKQATVDVGSFELQQLCREDSFDENSTTSLRRKTLNRRPSFYPVAPFEAIPISTNQYRFCSCCSSARPNDVQPLPSLRNAVDLMLGSLVQFLYANNHFIRTELVSIQSIGDLLAFHTLSYAFKDMVEATTNLAKYARRIKHIDTRTLTRTDRDEKITAQQTV
jgi:hypothetical protein